MNEVRGWRGKWSMTQRLYSPELRANTETEQLQLQLGSVSNPSEAACCLALMRRFSMLVVLLLRLPGRLPGADCSNGLFHTCWAWDRVW